MRIKYGAGQLALDAAAAMTNEGFAVVSAEGPFLIFEKPENGGLDDFLAALEALQSTLKNITTENAEVQRAAEAKALYNMVGRAMRDVKIMLGASNRVVAASDEESISHATYMHESSIYESSQDSDETQIGKELNDDHDESEVGNESKHAFEDDEG